MRSAIILLSCLIVRRVRHKMELKPCQEGRHRRFVSRENHCEHIGDNPEEKYIRQIKVDGDVFPPGKEPKICDYLLLNDTDKVSYYIELKGSDIRTAIEQIDSTVSLIAPAIKDYTVIFRRIILHKVRPHEIQDSSVIKWKRRHKAVIVSRQHTDIL